MLKNSLTELNTEITGCIKMEIDRQCYSLSPLGQKNWIAIPWATGKKSHSKLTSNFLKNTVQHVLEVGRRLKNPEHKVHLFNTHSLLTAAMWHAEP